jgi:hypothetical protein
MKLNILLAKNFCEVYNETLETASMKKAVWLVSWCMQNYTVGIKGENNEDKTF